MKHSVLTMVGVLALSLGACAADPEPEHEPIPQDDAVAATASFALTAQCGQCAAQAVQNVCGAQAQACLNDPNCGNASACVQACAPNDPLCIANCYQQASAALDALADCVVCQQCPVECAGAWTCSNGQGGGMNAGGGNAGGNMNAGGSMNAGGGMPGPSGQCDNTGVCQACLSCAAQGPCAAQVQACLNDPSCMLDPQAALDCTICQECANDCGAIAPPGLCGP